MVELPQEVSVKTSQQFEDLKLIRRSQAGDADAFGELVTKYRTKIFTMVFGMVHNEHDAWDLAQEGFLKANQPPTLGPMAGPSVAVLPFSNCQMAITRDVWHGMLSRYMQFVAATFEGGYSVMIFLFCSLTKGRSGSTNLHESA